MMNLRLVSYTSMLSVLVQTGTVYNCQTYDLVRTRQLRSLTVLPLQYLAYGTQKFLICLVWVQSCEQKPVSPDRESDVHFIENILRQVMKA